MDLNLTSEGKTRLEVGMTLIFTYQVRLDQGSSINQENVDHCGGERERGVSKSSLVLSRIMEENETTTPACAVASPQLP